MFSVCEALSKGEELLAAGGQGNACNESRWALCSVLGMSSSDLCLRSGDPVPDAFYARYVSLLKRRAAGEPFQYVLGDVEFCDLVLQVGPGVLVPRPETEELVELCCGLVSDGCSICDLCTGSGAIGLALGHCQPASRVYGTDVSADALSWARKNLAMSGLTNVSFFHGDLFSGLPRDVRFDLIVSNPPYVSESEYAELDPVVKDWEPRLALVAADDGLGLLRRIAVESMGWLKPGGWLACEMGCSQGAAMRSWLNSHGYESVSVRQDLSGRDRMIMGRRPLA